MGNNSYVFFLSDWNKYFSKRLVLSFCKAREKVSCCDERFFSYTLQLNNSTDALNIFFARVIIFTLLGLQFLWFSLIFDGKYTHSIIAWLRNYFSMNLLQHSPGISGLDLIWRTKMSHKEIILKQRVRRLPLVIR